MQKKNLFLFLTIFLIVSCSSIPDVHYYMIDTLQEEIEIEEAKYDMILGIEKFKSDRAYEGDRIVYRDTPYEVKFYNYHRWINSPPEIVTEKAIEQFTMSRLFKQVVAAPHFSRIDYLVRGSIKAFEELDEGNEWYGHVKIHFELVNLKDHSLIWQNILTQKIKASQRKPIEVVRALEMSLRSCLNEAIAEIDQVLSK